MSSCFKFFLISVHCYNYIEMQVMFSLQIQQSLKVDFQDIWVLLRKIRLIHYPIHQIQTLEIPPLPSFHIFSTKTLKSNLHQISLTHNIYLFLFLPTQNKIIMNIILRLIKTIKLQQYMKLSKSQPKIPKFSINKYDNFFAHKNWKEEMYMDLQNQEKNRQETQFQSVKSGDHRPKAKLTYSLHDKVSISLANKNKVGILETTPSVVTQRSIAKISQNSMTMPNHQNEIRTCQTQLLKLKQELNSNCNKKEKLQEKIHKTKGAQNTLRQKIELYEAILYGKDEKTQSEIQRIQGQTVTSKYNEEVRKNMKETLKSINLSLSHKILFLKKKLNEVQFANQTLHKQLDLQRKSESLRKNAKQKYNQSQNSKTTTLENKSTLAQIKINNQKHLLQLKNRFQAIQQYNKNQYDYETDHTNHVNGLNEIYTQKMLARILDSNFNKFQKQFLRYQECYAIIRMNSIFHRNQERLKQISLTSIVQQFDLLPVYYESFAITNTLKDKIKDSENKIKQLQKKRGTLLTKSMSAKFQDGVLKGEKQPKLQDFSQKIKALRDKNELIEKRKKTMIWVNLWIKKQVDKFDIKLSKKQTAAQSLMSICEHLRKQAKEMKISQNLEKKDTTAIPQSPKLAAKKSGYIVYKKK